jgi:hypothetical protein
MPLITFPYMTMREPGKLSRSRDALRARFRSVPNFPPPLSFQIGYNAYTASYPIVTRGLFQGVKRQGLEAYHLSHLCRG